MITLKTTAINEGPEQSNTDAHQKHELWPQTDLGTNPSSVFYDLGLKLSEPILLPANQRQGRGAFVRIKRYLVYKELNPLPGP